jgi:hypothetical protein
LVAKVTREPVMEAVTSTATKCSGSDSVHRHDRDL